MLKFTSQHQVEVSLLQDGIETVGPWPAIDGEWKRRLDEAVAESGEPAPYEPPPAPPITATGTQILTYLPDADIARLKVRDQLRLSARGADGIPAESAMLIRIAGKLGTTATDIINAALNTN